MTCSIEGCMRPSKTRGWCGAHYARWLSHGDPLGGRTPPGEAMAFLAKAVEYDGSGCLEWPFALSSNGYGKIKVPGGKLSFAHRIVLELAGGPPPSPNMQAAHAPVVCHNRRCVNPTHLRWATQAENEADKWADGTSNCGERNGRAKPRNLRTYP